MNYVKIDQIVCTGCGACVDSCPTDVIRMESRSRKANVVYAEDCQVCFLCEFDCPVDAILVSPRGWPEPGIPQE
ncbi:MAG TPA: ferredoxin family protein [Candidatus Binatia bacterium]